MILRYCDSPTGDCEAERRGVRSTRSGKVIGRALRELSMEYEEYHGGISGVLLDIAKVKTARTLKVTFLNAFGVCEKVPKEEEEEEEEAEDGQYST
eukprot:700561-Amphidinium_carterae.1